MHMMAGADGSEKPLKHSVRHMPPTAAAPAFTSQELWSLPPGVRRVRASKGLPNRHKNLSAQGLVCAQRERAACKCHPCLTPCRLQTPPEDAGLLHYRGGL